MHFKFHFLRPLHSTLWHTLETQPINKLTMTKTVRREERNERAQDTKGKNKIDVNCFSRHTNNNTINREREKTDKQNENNE